MIIFVDNYIDLLIEIICVGIVGRMEAIAKFDFNASADDELSFRKGQVVKILKSGDMWYRTEMGGRVGFVPFNYVDIKNEEWYLDHISRADAGKLLGARHEGAFIVRPSESCPGQFSLSVQCGSDGVQHFRIYRNNSGKFFMWIVKFDSLNQLVAHHRQKPVLPCHHIRLKDRQVLVRALYDFTPQEEDELQFNLGDIISLTDRTDLHWWCGNIGSRRGSFPSNYVTNYCSL